MSNTVCPAHIRTDHELTISQPQLILDLPTLGQTISELIKTVTEPIAQNLFLLLLQRHMEIPKHLMGSTFPRPPQMDDSTCQVKKGVWNPQGKGVVVS